MKLNERFYYIEKLEQDGSISREKYYPFKVIETETDERAKRIRDLTRKLESGNIAEIQPDETQDCNMLESDMRAEENL